MSESLRFISLFTGAGGLDLGLEAAGFSPTLCIESDPAARKTLETSERPRPLDKDGDIFAISPDTVLRRAGLRPGEATLVAGGPPCQPFSKAGYWANGDAGRLKDPRAKTLVAMLNIVELAQPQVVLVENVAGFVYRNKGEGLNYIERRFKEINKRSATKYLPRVLRLNAANYGVPQTRERVCIVASRDGGELQAPDHTHIALGQVNGSTQETYRTAWDAIGDLNEEEWPEELSTRGKYAGLLASIPEGRNYLWHTPEGIERWSVNGRSPDDAIFGWRTRYWSFLLKLAKNKPSWTISATPGPSTGPFHWRNRQLSVRELCRIQTFPDDYEIKGSRREQSRQVGNAVPPALGELLGLEIRRQLLGEHGVRRGLRLIPQQRPDCPEPEPIAAIPEPFRESMRRYAAHPGPGLGPRARQREQE